MCVTAGLGSSRFVVRWCSGVCDGSWGGVSSVFGFFLMVGFWVGLEMVAAGAVVGCWDL